MRAKPRMSGGLASSRRGARPRIRHQDMKPTQVVPALRVLTMHRSFVAPAPTLESFKSRYISAPHKGASELETLFQEHVEMWKADTEHYSSVTKMILHPSYRRIMGMGPAVLPILLRELRERPDHWLVALNAITGIDPAPEKSTFDEAVGAWLQWGVRQGYLR